MNMMQAPVRNATFIGASVFSHSGEFAPSFTDLKLTGRGLHFWFTRSYQSVLSDRMGELGRGWTASIARRIEQDGDSILYHDGTGKVFRFVQAGRRDYTSPPGLYAILSKRGDQFHLRLRHGRQYDFELPKLGGRIARRIDSNQNAIRYSYRLESIHIIDTLNRIITLTLDGGLIRELEDHAGRRWQYNYDPNGCLVEIVQPPTRDFPNGTTISYGYDDAFRLVSITDARGQRYLTNQYDDLSRVIQQEHGNGVFRMAYEELGFTDDGLPIFRTRCTRKNGSQMVLEHNDGGNVISRTLRVRKEAFAPGDTAGVAGNWIELVTRSTYNRNFECTSRSYPAGNRNEWAYSETEASPLNRGNLLEFTQFPADGVVSDQSRLATRYEYDQALQKVTRMTDPRGGETVHEYDEKGNLLVATYPAVTIQPVNGDGARLPPVDRLFRDAYRYNARGQVVQREHIDRTISRFFYYPVDDPIGAVGLTTATDEPDAVCGYLARVVRDSSGVQLTREYSYDIYGNQSAVYDGKRNPARLRYNAMGRLERITGREPFNYSIEYRYDASYNEIESSQTFERFPDNDAALAKQQVSSVLLEQKEYNALGNLMRRSIIGEGKTVVDTFVRDEDEQIVSHDQPLGNRTEYAYDERNRLIERRFGVGEGESYSDCFAYTLNGSLRTYTDGNGGVTSHFYDGLQRYVGFRNPVGTAKIQWLDEAGKVVRLRVSEMDDSSPTDLRAGAANGKLLSEAWFHYDQWNRIFRYDRVWLDPATGSELGASRWGDEQGLVSTVLEYAENGLPGRLWTENGNVVEYQYDGAGRVERIRDLTGESISIDYDENSNPILVRYLGPEVGVSRAERVRTRTYDEMDRLVSQHQNDEAPEHFSYNSFGLLVEYTGPTGIEIAYLADALGRSAGLASTIRNPAAPDQTQDIVCRVEYDDDYRLAARIDAAGNRTRYRYNALNRLVEAVFADGSAARMEYDANGNPVKVADPNGNEVRGRYDVSDRIIERISLAPTGGELVEQFTYDGLNRAVDLLSPGAEVRRTFDSLSRLLEEKQSDHGVRYTYNSAGNLIRLEYPGGEILIATYDVQNRTRMVQNASGETIASFDYRANNQIAKMQLGGQIEADLIYNAQNRLESILYRRADNQKLIEGFRYQYDAAGRMIQEIQLSAGKAYGERFFYDSADRPTRAQYGVQDLFSPTSPLEQVTYYEYHPEGPWKRRIDLDGQGQVLADRTGVINALNRYQSFGNLLFDYDANGNCIRKGTPNPGWCLYTYDALNRLIKSECDDSQGKTQTIEYFYDALGRQVRKVVTDENGIITEYTYVWAGNTLLEEYENGVLVRSYLYSIGSTPAQLSVSKNGRSNYFYILNGKGLASGLVATYNPNVFLEKYGYELTGASFVKEINGVPVAPPLRSSTVSSVLNSILTGDRFGSLLKDWQNGTLAGVGGRHITPELAAMLNSFNGVTGKGHNDARSTLGKQIQDFWKMAGYGNHSTGTSKQGGRPPGIRLGFGAKDWSLVGQGAGPSNSLVEFLNKPIPGFDKTVGGALGGVVVGGVRILSEHFPMDDPGREQAPSPGAAQSEADRLIAKQFQAKEGAKADTEKGPEKVVKTVMDQIADNFQRQEEHEKAWKEAEAEKAERQPEDEDEEAGDYPLPSDDEGGTTAYVNPDADTTVSLPSLHQLEAKFMELKHPVNPNGGEGTSGIYTSSPPSRGPGDLDPTIAYVTGESNGGGSIDLFKLNGGYLQRPVNPMDQPEPPALPWGGSGHWPNDNA